METSQHVNRRKIFLCLGRMQRLRSGAVFLGLVVFVGVFHLVSTGRIQMERCLNPCGFQQRYDLPCPTCGFTASVLAFSRGEVLRSISIQPAAGLICWVLAVGAFLAFLMAVFGVYLRFLEAFFKRVRSRYVILAAVIIISFGWAVTLLRAILQRS